MARLTTRGFGLLVAVIVVMSLGMSSAHIIKEIEQSPMLKATTQAWFNTSINATVIDDVGRKIGGALVHIVGNSSVRSTGSDGYVNITGLSDAPGSYVLWAEKPGYVDSEFNTTEVFPNSTSEATLVIVGGKILGTVISQGGLVPDATVSISDPPYSTAVSPVDGNYSLEGVPGGVRFVTASAPGYSPVTKEVSLGIGATYFPLNFELRTVNGSIAGYVYRAITPYTSVLTTLNNSSVSVNLVDRTVTVISGSDGHYIMNDIPEGTYTVTATKEGYFPNSVSNVQVVRGNRTDDVNITLSEMPTKMYGTVRSGTLLLPGVNISVEGTSWYTLSASAGNYELANITAGTYNVTATLTGYVTAQIVGVVIPVGGQVELDIELTAMPGGILRGQVLESNSDDPLPGVLVTIRNPGTAPRTTTTNVEGRFEFAGLVGGNYTIQFEKLEYKPMEVSNVPVKQDEVTNQTYFMSPISKGYGGFIFGFDLPHSMMILALMLTIIILGVAIYLRYRSIEEPETAPAVYDEVEEEVPEEQKPPANQNGPQEK